MLCHPETHLVVNYALRNVKSRLRVWRFTCFRVTKYEP